MSRALDLVACASVSGFRNVSIQVTFRSGSGVLRISTAHSMRVPRLSSGTKHCACGVSMTGDSDLDSS